MPKVHPSKVDLRELDDERDRLMDLCRKDVGIFARRMVEGKDRKRLALLMGVTPHTFGQKLILGRFTASEFLFLAHICGYDVEVKDMYQMMINDILD